MIHNVIIVMNDAQFIRNRKISKQTNGNYRRPSSGGLFLFIDQ